jgi:hypothetical protein
MAEPEPRTSESNKKKDIPLLPPNMDPVAPSFFTAAAARNRWERRRNKIREEIARNRRGEYKIPTWVLVLCLVIFVGAWAAWIIFAG